MMPNFALSLSFEGIRLLHRAADGWRIAGDVGLDSSDLFADLAVLRSKAIDLEAGGVRSKLIIPNDQIKYLALDNSKFSDDQRESRVKDALQGATPYEIDDLVYAISFDTNQTYVAAVARQTLVEAEAFAHEHRFYPVSWVALPDDGTFVGEPFFGATEGAAELIGVSTTVEPDVEKIIIRGDAAVPGVPNAPTAVPEDPAERTTDTPEEIDDTADYQTPPPLPLTDPVNASDTPPQSATAKVILPTPLEESTPVLPEGHADNIPTIGFASRRAPNAGKTPSLAGANREISTAEDTADVVLDTEDDAPSLAVAQAPEPRIAAGFLSRRKQPKHDAMPAPSAVTTKPTSEAQRLTIFGARKPVTSQATGGKPRFLGLILTAILLLFLAGVAAWASVFMDEGLSRFFGASNDRKIADVPINELPTPKEVDEPDIALASLSPSLSSEDEAVLDALSAPQAEPAVTLPQLSAEELVANYAVTGIWPLAPNVPQPASLISLDDLYVTSIDPVSPANDAVALPAPDSFRTDNTLKKQSAPTAAGTQFSLDVNGLVVPTVNGSVNPDGVVVFLGRPTAVPPKTPPRAAPTPVSDEQNAALAKLRPKKRPSNLVEQNERSSNGGLTKSELAELRPQARPTLERDQEIITQDAETNAAAAAAAASLAAVATEPDQPSITQEPENPQAVRASVRPDGRPRNFARIVKQAIAKRPKEEPTGTRVASIAPRTVTPSIPSSASVAKSATVRNAINLGRVNLIGVYGNPSNRRALVRLSNGRYQKVKVGDRIDGGRVSAIGDSELRYKKGSRNLTLKMPKG